MCTLVGGGAGPGAHGFVSDQPLLPCLLHHAPLCVIDQITGLSRCLRRAVFLR